MKKFVYQVAGFEFEDTVAFGNAWKQAKLEAASKNCAVYRLVIKNDKVDQEVFCKGGCFLSVDLVQPHGVCIF